MFFFFSSIRCTGRSTNTSRQQVNKLTSYIDGSVVYGETEERNRALRQFKDGKMKVGLGELLPVCRRTTTTTTTTNNNNNSNNNNNNNNNNNTLLHYSTLQYSTVQ